MGPRFCKRGNKDIERCYAERERLQWGHAFVSVETCRHQTKSVNHLKLQWGHAFVSVETRRHQRPEECAIGFNGATLL